MGFNTIFNNPFVGQNVKPKEKQAFIDPDADIVDAKFTVLDERKPFIYTQNSQNNSENPERFFSAQKNSFNFPESAHFSQREAAIMSEFYAASDRSLAKANGSNRYGSGVSSFSASNKAAAQVGGKLALIG